jgi:hypothetical protein
MAQYCSVCGYRSETRIHSVKCPACDSYAIKSTEVDTEKPEQSPHQRQLRLVLLIALWGYLIYEIYVRLYA